jgi:hypothetical protein
MQKPQNYINIGWKRVGVILIILLLHEFSLLAQPISLSVVGNWSLHIGPEEFIQAGNDLVGTYNSIPGEISMDISLPHVPNGQGATWKIDVRREDLDWNNTITLFVKRSGNGQGQGNRIQGGGAFTVINNISMEFFRCSNGNFNIPLQYELRDISVLLPAKSYSANIVYSITEL